ncbi:DUF6597 domain-containing transcriptional factor [Roseivirga sp.]|uniref:DUF6597 domain-containing transcriptional factor n=1 Tax=Roseivirga sp. TaxID=1964215 RepID=UPI003B524078
MIYLKEEPSPALSPWIDCLWLIDSEGESTVHEEKIIPDGFTETIWHYGDAYEININGQWEKQSDFLLAGQLTNHFYLRNTGRSGMVGIKWKPQALHALFQTDMPSLIDRVIPLGDDLQRLFCPYDRSDPTLYLKELNNHLTTMLAEHSASSPMAQVIDCIFESKGKADVEQLADLAHMSTRNLERTFKRTIGLSPKFYSRIIRLRHVFEMIESGNRNWSDIVYESGFYDQSHFIKNFKSFIGEDPGKYGFDANNMANFHLRQKS